MRRILVTGGPVPAKLDPVKLVTNKFKGGTISNLAESLSENSIVTYICHSSFAKMPKEIPRLKVKTFTDFHDYKQKVLDLAPSHDGIVLGAAVANLIPTWEYLNKKFPSHNYKPGDKVNVEFEIAPRIIDLVKGTNPKAKLFGFKLLAGHGYDELIRAAYETLLSSKSTVVFANDASNLKEKFMVTKERGVLRLTLEDLPKVIEQLTEDEYYSTEKIPFKEMSSAVEGNINKYLCLFNKVCMHFTKVPEGYYFGSVAVRAGNGFITTSRGKKDLSQIQYSYVERVDHERKIIRSGPMKASLNAPLLDMIFKNPKVDSIVHLHECDPKLQYLEYAPPGTVRDTMRNVSTSFNIESHGRYILSDSNGDIL